MTVSRVTRAGPGWPVPCRPVVVDSGSPVGPPSGHSGGRAVPGGITPAGRTSATVRRHRYHGHGHSHGPSPMRPMTQASASGECGQYRLRLDDGGWWNLGSRCRHVDT